MRAGRLRHTIVIQQKTDTVNAHYEAISAWSTFASVYAAVEPFNAKELLESQQLGTETNVRIVMRYMDGIDTTMRVLWNSRVFLIDGIINRGERNIELTLLCHEKL